jgi:hypothetical protein
VRRGTSPDRNPKVHSGSIKTKLSAPHRKQVQYRLDAELAEQFNQLCRARELPISQTLKEFIRTWINQSKLYSIRPTERKIEMKGFCLCPFSAQMGPLSLLVREFSGLVTNIGLIRLAIDFLITLFYTNPKEFNARVRRYDKSQEINPFGIFYRPLVDSREESRAIAKQLAISETDFYRIALALLFERCGNCSEKVFELLEDVENFWPRKAAYRAGQKQKRPRASADRGR